MIMSIKKSATLMILLSLSPMASATEIFFFDTNWISPSSLIKEISDQLSSAQVWAAGHSKTTGFAIGLSAFILLALLWEHSLRGRIVKANEKAFREGLEQGYNYAKAELEEKSKHELRTAKIDSYYEGYIVGNADKCKQEKAEPLITHQASISSECGSNVEQVFAELYKLLQEADGLQECALHMKANDLDVVVSLQV